MLLDQNHGRRFIERELNQGLKLREALHKGRKKLFLSPQFELCRLSRASRYALGASNGYARAYWFRLLAGHVAGHVGAKSPNYVASSPIYHLTIIDERHVQTSIEWDAAASRAAFAECRRLYANLMVGFNGIGMIDVSPYVYVQNVLQGPFVFAYHLHAIIWGMTQDEINRRCEQVRRRTKSLLPIATAVKCTKFKPEDFRQLCWYIAKMPRKQYQLHIRGDARRGWRQFKSTINGVNSVRTYSNQWGLTLDELTLSSGQGHVVLKKMLSAVRRWRRRAGWKPSTTTAALPSYCPTPPEPLAISWEEFIGQQTTESRKGRKRHRRRRRDDD
jgi:hypothetical protein